MTLTHEQARSRYALGHGTIHDNADEAARRWPEMTVAWPASERRATVGDLLDLSRKRHGACGTCVAERLSNAPHRSAVQQ